MITALVGATRLEVCKFWPSENRESITVRIIEAEVIEIFRRVLEEAEEGNEACFDTSPRFFVKIFVGERHVTGGEVTRLYAEIGHQLLCTSKAWDFLEQLIPHDEIQQV